MPVKKVARRKPAKKNVVLGGGSGRISAKERKVLARVSKGTSIIDGRTMVRHAPGRAKASKTVDGGVLLEVDAPVHAKEFGVNPDDDQSIDTTGITPDLKGDVTDASGGDTVPHEAMRYSQNVQTAEQINKRWSDRIQRDGTKAFVCPLCNAADREPFVIASAAAKHVKAAHKACTDHIKSEHKAQVQQLKLEKANENLYSPRPITISPDRTVADVVGPQLAEMMDRMKANGTGLDEMKQMSREAAGTAGGVTVPQLKLMLDHQIADVIRKIGDKNLRDFTNWAYFNDKKVTVRMLQREIDRRNEGREQATLILTDF